MSITSSEESVITSQGNLRDAGPHAGYHRPISVVRKQAMAKNSPVALSRIMGNVAKNSTAPHYIEKVAREFHCHTLYIGNVARGFHCYTPYIGNVAREFHCHTSYIENVAKNPTATPHYIGNMTREFHCHTPYIENVA